MLPLILPFDLCSPAACLRSCVAQDRSRRFEEGGRDETSGWPQGRFHKPRTLRPDETTSTFFVLFRAVGSCHLSLRISLFNLQGNPPDQETRSRWLSVDAFHAVTTTDHCFPPHRISRPFHYFRCLLVRHQHTSTSISTYRRHAAVRSPFPPNVCDLAWRPLDTANRTSAKPHRIP